MRIEETNFTRIFKRSEDSGIIQCLHISEVAQSTVHINGICN